MTSPQNGMESSVCQGSQNRRSRGVGWEAPRVGANQAEGLKESGERKCGRP